MSRLQDELEELERTDPAVRAAAQSYDEQRWSILWRASMAGEIEEARAAARQRVQTDARLIDPGA